MNTVPNFLSNLPCDIQIYVHRFTPFPIQSDEFRDVLILPIKELWKKVFYDPNVTNQLRYKTVALIIRGELFRSLRVKIINHLFSKVFKFEPSDLYYFDSRSFRDEEPFFSPISLLNDLQLVLKAQKLVQIDICRPLLFHPSFQRTLRSKALLYENCLELYGLTNSEVIFHKGSNQDKQMIFRTVTSSPHLKNVKKITMVDFLITEEDIPKILALRKVVDISICTSRSDASKESTKNLLMLIFLAVIIGMYSPIREFGFSIETLLGIDFKMAIVIGMGLFFVHEMIEKSLDNEDRRLIMNWQSQINEGTRLVMEEQLKMNQNEKSQESRLLH